VPDEGEWVRMVPAHRDRKLAVIGDSWQSRKSSTFSELLLLFTEPTLSEHSCRSTESFQYVHSVPKRPHEPFFERCHEDAIGDRSALSAEDSPSSGATSSCCAIARDSRRRLLTSGAGGRRGHWARSSCHSTASVSRVTR
jgi:hypothetical protein